jgi:hypothetical protein
VLDEHLKLERDARVAGWVSGRLTDSPFVALSDDELTFGGIRLRGNRDSVHRLPAGFPERRDTRLSDDVLHIVGAHDQKALLTKHIGISDPA